MLLTTRDNNTSIFVYFSKSGIQNSKSGIASFWKAPVQGHLFFNCQGRTAPKLYYGLQYRKLIIYGHKSSLGVFSNELMLVI